MRLLIQCIIISVLICCCITGCQKAERGSTTIALSLEEGQSKLDAIKMAFGAELEEHKVQLLAERLAILAPVFLILFVGAIVFTVLTKRYNLGTVLVAAFALGFALVVATLMYPEYVGYMGLAAVGLLIGGGLLFLGITLWDIATKDRAITEIVEGEERLKAVVQPRDTGPSSLVEEISFANRGQSRKTKEIVALKRKGLK